MIMGGGGLVWFSVGCCRLFLGVVCVVLWCRLLYESFCCVMFLCIGFGIWCWCCLG